MTTTTRPALKRGDRVTLTAQVEEVRADGVVVLTIPASTSLIPSVVLTSLDILGHAEPDDIPSGAAPPRFAIGLRVVGPKGERGQVVAADLSVPKVRRLKSREDVVMVQWTGRSLPTWHAPEELKLAR